MISPEQRSRIRTLFFAEHWKVGTISSELALHRETVQRALELRYGARVVARPLRSFHSRPDPRKLRALSRRSVRAVTGVTRAVLYDNLKSVVLDRQGDLIRFHPRILELAGHYHFAPTPVGIARGNEKPRVERRIRDLRESFFAARSFSSLADLNQQLDSWIERVVHARRVPGDDIRTVGAALTEEQKRLLPLPEHGFDPCHVQPVSSGKTPYVRFDRNDYSIPHTLVRKPLTLVASDTTVRVLDGDKEVARHQRSWDMRQQIEDES